MKILSNLIKPAVLLVFVLLFASCYKEDEFMVSNPLLVSAHEGVTLNKWIPEKNAILGTQKDATGAVTKIEYDIATKTIKPLNYYSDFTNYAFIAPNKFYTTFTKIYGSSVDIIDIMNGSVAYTYNFSYPVYASCVSKDKLFTVTPSLGPLILRAANLTTNTELYTGYANGDIDNMIVSKNSERIFTATDQFDNIFSSYLIKNNIFSKIYALLKPNTYSMSDDGKYFITTNGNLYNDSFVNIKNFGISPDFVRGSFISPNGKEVLVYNNSGYDIYTIPEYDFIKSEDFIRGRSGANEFIKAVPFIYNGQMFISTTYKDPFLGEKTYITSIEN
jgi:hypothetical protein